MIQGHTLLLGLTKCIGTSGEYVGDCREMLAISDGLPLEVHGLLSTSVHIGLVVSNLHVSHTVGQSGRVVAHFHSVDHSMEYTMRSMLVRAVTTNVVHLVHFVSQMEEWN
jgi:hypothetical protein